MTVRQWWREARRRERYYERHSGSVFDFIVPHPDANLMLVQTATIDAYTEATRRAHAVANERRIWGVWVRAALAAALPKRKTRKLTKPGAGEPQGKELSQREDFYLEVQAEAFLRAWERVLKERHALLLDEEWQQRMGCATLSARRDKLRHDGADAHRTVTHLGRLAAWPEYPTDDVVAFAEVICASLILGDPVARVRVLKA